MVGLRLLCLTKRYMGSTSETGIIETAEAKAVVDG